MRRLAECYDIFQRGDTLTDEEVLALREAFNNARNATCVLGPRFYIAFSEANTRYNDLDYIARARGIAQ